MFFSISGIFLEIASAKSELVIDPKSLSSEPTLLDNLILRDLIFSAFFEA